MVNKHFNEIKINYYEVPPNDKLLYLPTDPCTLQKRRNSLKIRSLLSSAAREKTSLHYANISAFIKLCHISVIHSYMLSILFMNSIYNLLILYKR